MRRRGGYKGGRSRQRERHGIHGWILFLPAGEGWRSVRPLFRAVADSIDNGTKGAFPGALEFGRILEWDGGSINRRRGRRGRSGESDPAAAPRSKSNCPAVHGVRRPQCRPHWRPWWQPDPPRHISDFSFPSSRFAFFTLGWVYHTKWIPVPYSHFYLNYSI
jgi:hypothetical protein